MPDTVRTAVLGGLFALLGAIDGAAVTCWSQVELARQKLNSDVVLKALESNSPEQRQASLRLLTETRLPNDPKIQEGVKAYSLGKRSQSGSGSSSITKCILHCTCNF